MEGSVVPLTGTCIARAVDARARASPACEAPSVRRRRIGHCILTIPINQRGRVPQYVIERELPGAGKLSPEELQAISQKSCGVLSNMGPQIQWVHSYVTGDKIYCIYRAPNAEMVREHARRGGFPANRVEEVKSVIDPTTAE
jgi:hypothetical protein